MFISNSEYSAYFGGGVDLNVFLASEAAAARIICDKCGIDNPADPSGAPDWVKYPAAAITNKIIISRNSAVAPERLSVINENYKQAIAILEDHIKKSSNQKITFIESEDTFQW